MTTNINQGNTGETGSRQTNSKVNMQANEDYRHFLTTLNWIERLLLFMSKTELYILQYCTRSTRMTLTSVGAMVVITGILAFFSSFFAVKNSFFRADQTTSAMIIPFFVALGYAVAIMAFDREIVSATDKRAAWMRIPFAVLIGIVIAYPIELQLQQGRISAELKKIAEERTKDKTDEIKKLEIYNEQLLEEAILPLKEKQKNLTTLRDQEQQSAAWESQPEHGLCRGRCAEHKANAEKYQEQLDQIKIAIEEERAKVDNDKRALDNKARIGDLKAEKIADENSSYDLLSQAVALHSIYKSPDYGGTVRTLGWFLRFFFVCFELFPVLIKMTMAYTEYHAYLDSRMRLNVNKRIALTNHKLAYYRDNPDKILMDDTEITDFLAHIGEDREIDINRPRDTRNV